MSIKARNIFSVVIGTMTIFVVGFSLFPILEFLIKKSLVAQIHNRFFFDSILYELIWLGIASFLGGFITSTISKTVFHSLITGALALTMILLTGIFVNNNFSLITLLTAISSFFFCVMGGLTQKYIAIKKYKNE